MDEQTEPTEEHIDAAARAHYHMSVLNAKPFDLVGERTQELHREMATDLLRHLQRSGWTLARIAGATT